MDGNPAGAGWPAPLVDGQDHALPNPKDLTSRRTTIDRTNTAIYAGRDGSRIVCSLNHIRVIRLNRRTQAAAVQHLNIENHSLVDVFRRAMVGSTDDGGGQYPTKGEHNDAPDRSERSDDTASDRQISGCDELGRGCVAEGTAKVCAVLLIHQSCDLNHFGWCQ